MKREVFWKNPGYKRGKSLKGIYRSKFLIVGGGITGLTLVYFLLERGVVANDILLVEADVVGSGSTGRSAGMLVPEMETETNVGWHALVARYGVRFAKTYRRAHLDALHTIEKIIREGHIVCDAHKGDFLILARDEEAKRRVRSDIRARRMMGERPAALRGIYLANEFGSPGFIFAERARKGLSVNPLALSQGIATYLRRRGIRIFERTPFISAFGKTARFPHGAVEFGKIAYVRGVGEEHAKLHKFVTTVAITKKLARDELNDLRLEDLDLFIDEEGVRSFHYGKITGDGRLLLGYGDVRSEVTQAATALHLPHLRNIRRFLKQMFPNSALTIDYAWSGAYAIGVELLPIVMFKENSVLINGAGIQLGSVTAAEYAAARLLGKSHPFRNIWHPKK